MDNSSSSGAVSRRRIVQGGLALTATAALPRMALAQAGEFQIGWIRPTTGRLASPFAPLYAGGLIAIDEINAAGGILGRKLVIVWMASNVHIGMAFNTMARMGWLPPVIGHVNLFNDALFELVPLETLRSVYGIYYRNWTYTDREPRLGPRQLALSAKLQQVPTAKGIEAFIAGTPHYDFLHLLKQVIEQEKSFDVEAIRRGLNGVRNYAALLGSLNFSETQHAGIAMADLTLASVASGRDPRSVGAARLRAPGA